MNSKHYADSELRKHQPEANPFPLDGAGILSAYDEDDWAKAGIPSKHGIDGKPSLRGMQQAVRQGIETGSLKLQTKAEEIASVNLATAVSRKVATASDMVNLPSHYARFKIEPIRFIAENKLDWFQGNIVKYVLRHDAKNGMEDIRKAIRYANMYLRYLGNDPDWWQSGRPEDFRHE